MKHSYQCLLCCFLFHRLLCALFLMHSSTRSWLLLHGWTVRHLITSFMLYRSWWWRSSLHTYLHSAHYTQLTVNENTTTYTSVISYNIITDSTLLVFAKVAHSGETWKRLAPDKIPSLHIFSADPSQQYAQFLKQYFYVASSWSLTS